MNKTPVTPEFIDQQKQVLLNLQERLSGKKVIQDKDEPNGSDFGDLSAAVTAAENALALVSNTQQTLRDVNIALLKIQNGTYGVCEFTAEQIGQERLEAIPWARFTIEAQSAFEKEGRSGRRGFEGGSLFEDSTKAGDGDEESTPEE